MASITKGQKRMLLLLSLVVLYAVYDLSSNWDDYFGFYTGKKKQSAAGSTTVQKIMMPIPRL